MQQDAGDNDFESVSSALERLSVRANVTSGGRPTTVENAPHPLFAGSATGADGGVAKSEAAARMLFYAPPPEVPEPNSLVDKDSLEPASITTSASGSEIQDQIRATHLRRLDREMTPTISDVYHERNIGLGLAPSLSKLLLPVTEEKDAGKAHTETLSKEWLSSAILQQFGQETAHYTDLSRRDEGDGRSIADSQYSTGSYTKIDSDLSQALVSAVDIEGAVPVPQVRTSHKNYPPPPIPPSRPPPAPPTSSDNG